MFKTVRTCTTSRVSHCSWPCNTWYRVHVLQLRPCTKTIVWYRVPVLQLRPCTKTIVWYRVHVLQPRPRPLCGIAYMYFNPDQDHCTLCGMFVPPMPTIVYSSTESEATREVRPSDIHSCLASAKSPLVMTLYGTCMSICSLYSKARER